jgi:hypothetical protein
VKTTEAISRRYFFSECGVGVGKVALASLLGHGVAREASGGITSGNPLAPRPSHHAPKAKRVIFLFMAGGPSHIDLFDHKPALRKYDGEEVPAEVLEGQELPFIERDAALMSSPFRFSRHGNSAAELSEALTHLPQVVDDIAFVKSIHTDAFNHAPAQIFMNTGHLQLGKPSVGAWVTYGLGSECENLPAFVTLASGRISGGAACYGCGFLPSVYQGVQFRSQGEPILFVNNPSGFDRKMQRDTLHAIGKLNRQRLDVVGDPEIAGRINSYEMAFRMQTSAPELTDLRQERKETLELYGAELGKSSFANSCLLARRLVERGVRFVEVFHSGWDHHSNVVGNVKRQCALTDRATTALILDLKRRGLLDDTLVIWGGEFGRTPMVENNPALGRTRGRDHHPNAFTMWLAGGGIKPGQTIGRTDDLGYHIVEDPVHVHDLQATLLHLLGLDHTKLTFRHQGRDFRLTDVGGEVVSKLLA